MASHHRLHHHPQPHHHQPPPPPPPPPPCTHCCCNNPSYTCCAIPPPPPPPPQDHLVQAIASLLSQQQHHAIIPPTHHYSPHTHYPKSHNLLAQAHPHHHHHQQEAHSTISSLLHRIQSLESSLTHHSLSSSSSSSSLSLRHAAARVIQTHFRSFLVHRSRTLRSLKRLALIKSTFNSLKSSLSQNTHLDFIALSHKAFDLLLQLDSIEGCDPMIVDGKRSISRDLVQLLDSIEGVAVKKHMRVVKAAKSGRVAQRVNKSRDSCDDDEKRKLLQNLRGRVERISRLCKVSEDDGQDLDHEGVRHVVGGGDYDYDDDGDGDGDANVLVSRRNELTPKKTGVFVQRQGVQPRVKKSVTFAENGKIYEVYGSSAYEPEVSGDVVCLDGSSSSDDQGEVLENVGCAVVVDSSQGGAEDDEEAFAENGGSPHSSDDGGRNPRRVLNNGGRDIVKGQLQAHQERILFSAPLPVKMENKADLTKSKVVRILT